jgi:sRNA-binding carbon storage regulator CsrA
MLTFTRREGERLYAINVSDDAVARSRKTGTVDAVVVSLASIRGDRVRIGVDQAGQRGQPYFALHREEVLIDGYWAVFRAVRDGGVDSATLAEALSGMQTDLYAQLAKTRQKKGV